MKSKKLIPVKIRDTVYPSAAEAAKALGVTRSRIYSALTEGTQDRVGLVRHKPIPVIIGEVYFPSLTAAAKACECSPSEVKRLAFKSGERGKRKLLGKLMKATGNQPH